MLLAYIDEFGHVGPYISDTHPKFNNHPVFGYAGFLIPAHNVRAFGAYFEFLKAKLLAYEVEKSGKHPHRWEKKGASLLTTRNIKNYGHEIQPALERLFRKLFRLNGKLVFVGQVKPLGSEKETGESTFDRNSHVLRQIITEIANYADQQNEDVLIFLDSVDSKAREDALAVSASFIYSSTSTNSVKRVLEAPMQLESHLYGTVQFADWICALMGRATHFHLAQSNEFTWAPELLDILLGQSKKSDPCTSKSRIQPYQSVERQQRSIWIRSLRKENKYLTSKPQPTTQNWKGQRVGEQNPQLKAFYQSLKRN